MNKTSKIVTLVLVIVAIIIIVSISMSGKSSTTPVGSTASNSDASNTPSAIVSETKKVSGSLTEYQNAELGFSLKYPSDWEKEEGNAGVNLIIPIDKSQTSTIATLNIATQVISGTCAFPPVTTIKDRGTIKVGANTFNMISMSNTVQGRVYTNRMYSLQKDDVCYMFSFASIALNPTSKGLTGSNITVAQNNNKAITTAADNAFTDMIKTFTFITGPQGQDETKVSPKK